MVAAADPSFCTEVADAVEATRKPVEAEPVNWRDSDEKRTVTDDVDGAIVDGAIQEPVEVIERLTDEREFPVVVLCDGSAGSERIAGAIEAGATDVFPRATENRQYELVVERIERQKATDRTEGVRDYKQAYQQVFENINEGLVVHEPESGRIVDVNERFCEMNGYEREELLDESIGKVTVPGEEYGEAAAQEKIQQARVEGPQLFEWRNQRSNGEIFPVEVFLTVVQLDGRERVLATVSDITELNRREREYEQIFNGVTESIVIQDPETAEIVDANETFLDRLGYGDMGEVREVGFEGLSVTEEGFTKERAREIHQRVLETGEPELVEWKQETKSGDHRWIEGKVDSAVINGEERVLSMQRDITERKRREREYEEVFNGVKDAITIFNPETGEIEEINDAYRDLFGYEDLETFQELGIDGLSVNEEGFTGERGKELIRKTWESGESETVEWLAESVDGERVWLEVTLSPAEIHGKERVLSIQRDITERKHRERAIQSLQEATERLQTADTPAEVATIGAEAAGDTLDVPMSTCWLHDDDDECLRLVATTGAVPEDEVATEIPSDRYEYDLFREGVVREATHPNDAQGFLDTGVFLPLGDHGLIAAGTRRPSRVGGRVLDVAQALADHLSTALDRVERAQAVQESERRFRLIANRIDEVIYLTEPNFAEMLYVNPAYENIWGRPKEELDTDARKVIEGIDHRDRDRFEDEFEGMLEEMQEGDPDDSYDFEFRVRKPDGELRWVHATWYAVELGGGTGRFVGIAEDITARKHREQRLEVFNRILRHNLRNQLDVIRSHAEVLAERSEDGHPSRILAAVDQLADIGARARKTDRIMSMGDNETVTQVSQSVQELVDDIESRSGGTEIETSLRPVSLVTNEEALQTAVESALVNAVEHADSRVEISVEDRQNGCVVTVADDGPGIPEEELLPIETGRETNLQHGRGLGLWQLRWSVDRLNGELSFDTSDGTTVQITVPNHGTAE